MTRIYVACFHSEPGRYQTNTHGQFKVVEEAIVSGEWHYDNGDDPSFYVAKRNGPLTWGICRQNARNPIRVGDIVVFISYRTSLNDITYSMCSIATVSRKLSHQQVKTDEDL